MSVPHIYCDMDGVVADFVTSATTYFKISPERESKAFKTLWNGVQGTQKLPKEWPTFWMDLPVLPHALQLWKMIAPYNPSILTAIPHTWPSSAVGKQVWCRRHLPGFSPRNEFIAVTDASHKQRWAKQSDGTPNILIDDFAKNIAQWTAAGGIGITYVDGAAGLATVKRTIESLGLNTH